MFFIVSQSHAQISNFIVNGSSTNFTMASGDVITWTYDIAVGGTAMAEIWYDVNQNGLIDPAVDRLFTSFSQTDGNSSGNGGPPDLDGVADGHVYFSFKIGLAPGKYVMKFSNNGIPSYITGTVTPLASPVHSISGNVTPPPGKSARYIIVELSTSGEGQNTFWDGVTDSLGNYAILMDADTSGNPWRIRLSENPYPPSIVTPEETSLVVTGNHTGYNITIFPAAAQVAGYIFDENGVPLTDRGAFVSRSDSSGYFSRRAKPDGNGFFQIGLLAGDLTSGGWYLESETNSNSNITTTEMQSHIPLGTMSPGDSIFKVLHVYTTNSTIRGTVLLNGNPATSPLQVTATSPDTAISVANIDSTNGRFVLPVTDKLHSYNISLNFSSYGWIIDPLTAHAGDSNVVLNLHSTTLAIEDHRPGWNILAVPLLMSNLRKVDLFNGALTPAFTYVPGSGYRSDTVLQYGKGYWMKFNDSSSNWLYGFTITRETLNVLAGWNMIAPPSNGFSTGNIVAVGTTPITPYFGYSGSYYPTASLYGGYGFWVKVSSNGQLILNASGINPSTQSKPPSTAKPAGDEADGIRELTITDATGEARSVYCSSGAAKRDRAWYELPPVPPPGVMDVRFSSQQRIEFGSGRASARIPIDISSAVYPLKISLADAGVSQPVRLEIKGAECILAGGREVTVADEHSSVALILGESTKPALPAVFALRQNYPNPFNPTTLISYDIASASRVRLVVYNTLGQEVARPIDEFREAGSYEYLFSSNDLPSGVYFYRLSAGTFTAVHKMILMK
jgi:hypothetical protein